MNAHIPSDEEIISTPFNIEDLPTHFDFRTQWKECAQNISNRLDYGAFWEFANSTSFSERYCFKKKELSINHSLHKTQYLVIKLIKVAMEEDLLKQSGVIINKLSLY